MSVNTVMASIFISMANYKDLETLHTVSDVLQKSSKQHKITLCVFSQINENDTRWDILDTIPEVLHIRHPSQSSQGVCWARHQIQQYYTDQDFYLQLDSHMLMTEHWDQLLINDYALALQQHGRPVLTCYPARYEFDSQGNRFVGDPHTAKIKIIVDETSELPHGLSIICPEMSQPEPVYGVSGGFIFAAGDFVKNVPYDPELFFQGEEITLAIRAYCAGYQMFCPTKFVCAHLYQNDQLPDCRRPLFWDVEEDQDRDIRWWLREQTGKYKTALICQGKWHGKYGINNLDLYNEYRQKVMNNDQLDISINKVVF